MRTGWFFAALVIGGLSSISFGYSGGDGSAGNPYQIADVNDLLELSADTGNYDKSFILTANIDMDPNLPGGQIFTTAIIAPDTSSSYGFQGTAFTGTINGNGHKVTHLAIDAQTLQKDYLGLIGMLEDAAIIESLGVENVTITNVGPDSSHAGGLAGQNKGTITNCWISGSIFASRYAGGLVGYNHFGAITACYTGGTINSSTFHAGGLVGTNFNGTITNCHTSCSVASLYNAGGLAGQSTGGTIMNCYAIGSVEISGPPRPSNGTSAGGLIGYGYNCSILYCFATAPVTLSASDYSPAQAGGLVGTIGGSSISYCFATGSVSINAPYAYQPTAGGLIGAGHDSLNLTACYAAGSVYVESLALCMAGGLIGNFDKGTISDSYAVGSAAATSPSYVGGLIGKNNTGLFSICFWDTETSGTNDGVGNVNPDPNGVFGKTTEEMKMLSTFTITGWDFTNETANGTSDIWRMCMDGVDYPRLNWESIDGDFACPDGVAIEDLDYFVGRWLMANCTSDNNYCGGADGDLSGDVDLADYVILAEHWLERV